MDIKGCAALLESVTAITVAAATAIGRAQGQGEVRFKADGSPVTAADEAAEQVIRDALTRLAPDLPVISEEQAAAAKPPITGASYCVVDPLDGTREFIAGRDEYTINIAFVVDGRPMLGIIAAPALGLIWRGIVGRGAERMEFTSQRTSAPQPLHTRSRPQSELIVMVSRSHLDARTEAYLASLPHTGVIRCGSSLKFCRLAEGTADHYPRLAPTRDWDVAAGHALLGAAGGSVIDRDGAALTYGTPDLCIPSFLAWGGPAPTEGALTGGY
jgi:3'(2'), 5'-bisphosphate nucleotidase